MRIKPSTTIIMLFMVILCTACKSPSTPPNTPQLVPTQASPGNSIASNGNTTDSLAASPTQASGEPTSNQLINTALQNGEIDEETALTYEVYALFKDPRLPLQFQSNVSLTTDSHVLDDVQAQFASLSPETQAELLPFLMPPAYMGSWADPNVINMSGEQKAENASRWAQFGLPCKDINTEEWDYKSAMHSPVRFWWNKIWPGDEQVANAMIAAMDDDIWPKLTALMGHTPLPDGGTPCDGGSSDLDVYITPLLDALGYAPQVTPPGCRETPAFITIRSDVKPVTLTHEFMHAIQWSYPTANGCMYPGDYAWLAEATATWAQDYVYPSDNYEQGYVWEFYNPNSGDPTLSLYEGSAGNHQYGAYLFFFYLTRHFSQPEIVSRAWGNTTSTGSVEATDLAIPGGLKDIWGDFAIRNIVEPPEDDYQTWDNLNVKPSGKSLTEAEVSGDGYFNLPGSVSPLSIEYVWYTFGDARLVTFLNGYTYNLEEESMENDMLGVAQIDDGTTKFKFDRRDDVEDIKVQAYFKVEGDTDWQLEDWTDKETMSFCRDASDERLTDLYIVISNSSKDNDFSAQGSYLPTVKVSDIGCWRYSGNGSFEMTGQGSSGQFTDKQDITEVTFERTDSHPNIPYPFLRFQVMSGKMERTYEYVGTKCQGDGNMSTALYARNKYELHILYGAIDGPSKKRYGGTSNVDQPINVEFQCDDAQPPPSDIPSLPWFYTDVLSDFFGEPYILASGSIMDGDDNMIEEGGNAQLNYTWYLEPFMDEGGGGSEGSNSVNPSGSGIINPGGQLPTQPGGANPTAQATSTPGFPDVPRYPNIETEQQNQYGMLILTTSDPMLQVAQFYQKEMVEAGWQDGSLPYDASSESIQLNFLKGTRMIIIGIGRAEGITTFMITQAGG